MKKIFFIMSAALAFFASCSSEDSENAGNVVSRTTFTATFEQSELDGISQKTVLADNGTSVNWESGDEIAVWYGSTKVKYVATPTETATTAKIVLAQGETIPQGTTPTYAVYPYSAATAYGEVTQPSAQTFTANSFANGANVAYGTINEEKRTIYFKNLGSVVKITLSNPSASDISYSNLQLKADAAVAGSFTVDGSSVANIVSGENTVTISPKEGYITVPANGNVACYFSIMTLNNITKLNILASDQTLAEKTSNISFERNKIYPMKDITAKHEYVDLGLPSGIKWATCNVGAETPETYGDYFSWGETLGYNGGKRTFSWSGYKWGTVYNKMTKYCTSSSYGTVDNKTVLEPEDDAATANWGEGWRTPTQQEMKELADNCTYKWTTQNKVAGMLVTSKNNGNTIFLPATGYYYYSKGPKNSSTGRLAYYSSSTLYSACYCAYSLYINKSGAFSPSSYLANQISPYDGRDYGIPVRAVYQEAE